MPDITVELLGESKAQRSGSNIHPRTNSPSTEDTLDVMDEVGGIYLIGGLERADKNHGLGVVTAANGEYCSLGSIVVETCMGHRSLLYSPSLPLDKSASGGTNVWTADADKLTTIDHLQASRGEPDRAAYGCVRKALPLCSWEC